MTSPTSQRVPVVAPPPETVNDGLVIDSATRSDLFRIAGLLRSAAPACVPLTPHQVRARRRQFEVVRDPVDGVVAAVALRPVERRRVELGSLVVAPSHHHQGLGTRLVERAVSQCVRRDLELVCVTRNPRFFARLGFRCLPFCRERSSSPNHRRGQRTAMACLATLTHHRRRIS